jgi:hypothetical protein
MDRDDCEQTDNRDDCEQTDNSDDCEQTDNRDDCEQADNRDDCEQTDNRDDCEQTDNRDDCEQTDNRDDCEQTDNICTPPFLNLTSSKFYYSGLQMYGNFYDFAILFVISCTPTQSRNIVFTIMFQYIFSKEHVRSDCSQNLSEYVDM